MTGFLTTLAGILGSVVDASLAGLIVAHLSSWPSQIDLDAVVVCFFRQNSSLEFCKAGNFLPLTGVCTGCKEGVRVRFYKG